MSQFEEIIDDGEVVAKVEEVSDEEQQIDEIPSAERVVPGKYKQTRSEKKARKAVAKLGLSVVQDVSRVTIKRGREISLNIPAPDVYVTSNGKTYIIFGEAKMDDGLSGADWDQLAAGLNDGAMEGDDDDFPPELVEADGEAAPVDADDQLIDLVLGQVPGASREAAAAALEANNNDVVSAVFNLKVSQQDE
eukprot:TRINITY_DN227_c0_g1_i2.p1 TRINITY_DN227_c0_g1~~TRINITY_DN227_c0_g1_i2.p1  ORF type:complete len:192 (-),score=81.05 TRINITY_DN227_c0_g1_i2:49-624(-)